MQWGQNCFDPIATSLEETLAAIDTPGENPDERVAEHLLLLGIVQSRQEKYEAAVASLTRALGMFRGVFGSDHLKTAVTMGHLARAHRELGHLDQAAELFPKALERLEVMLPNHLVLAKTLNGYAQLLLERGDAAGKAYSVRALDIVESLGGGKRSFLLQENAGAPAPTVRAETTIVPRQ